MISEKMKGYVAGSSAIRAMFEEGKKMAAKYGAENVYDFSLGNPSIPAPKEVEDAIIEVLKENTLVTHGYMNNSGFEDVRSAIAEHINKLQGTAFDESNILMTVGAAGGLNVILKTLLNPGDEVIVFSPYFGEYRSYVSNYDGVIVEVMCDDNFMPDCNALKSAVTNKTKAVIINNPNNPTGVVYSEDVIKELSKALCEKQEELGISIYLIADEPYRELAYDGVEVPYLTKYYKNTIVGYSYSKSLSLPGERIGYLVIPSEIDDADDVKAAANVANRILGYVNAPSLFQKVIAKCLDAKTDVESYDKNRKLLYASLVNLGFEVVKPQGAFYLWMKSPVSDEKEFVSKAKEFKLLLVPGSSFGKSGYVRLAYCVSFDTIKNSIAAFEKLSKAYNLK